MTSRPDVAPFSLPPTNTLIDGRWLEGESRVPVLDKFDESVFCHVEQATRGQIASAVATTYGAYQRAPLAPVDRARVLRKAAELLVQKAPRFSAIMTTEAGFTAADARAEVERAAVTLTICAEEATRVVGEAISFGASSGQHNRMGFTIRVPLGVVCAITPFNSPLNTVIHKIAPALACGNGVVLKPSVLTPLTSALLCETLLEAGLPPALLALVQGRGSVVGNWLLEEQAIGFYTFTGSTGVGRTIQAGAGLRRTQMELGSISSVIVCADGDLKKAAPKIANASFRKAGQVCTSIQRLYVEEGAVDALVGLLSQAVAEMPAGDPRRPETRVGPLITMDDAMRVEGWIKEACSEGAVAVTGGERTGTVIQPTLLTNVQRSMKVVDQEIFGPVLTMIPFKTLDEAIAGANDSPYGLAAGIFTADVNKALRAARELRFGAVHVNETSSSRADAMPFGGVKESGFGKEGPVHAIQEYTEERVITFTP